MNTVEIVSEEAVEASTDCTSTMKCVRKINCSKVIVRASQYGMHEFLMNQ
jgi:hypothetical protein